MVGGIIPARAGFTRPRGGAGAAAEDHPRSRGVYSVKEIAAKPINGSSPLARGLPRLGRLRRITIGIIPARAGFTASVSVSGSRPRDHPRSRGVYKSTPNMDSILLGSSPLARGLHAECGYQYGTDRIIPARAGFTRLDPYYGDQSGDHPRSRGVYSEEKLKSRTENGSSPLARGLLLFTAPDRDALWIIPARAGFTAPLWCWGSLSRDHPRSRGVYPRRRRPRRPRPGSSPLARGLRVTFHGRPGILRIIPARAGFTIRASSLSYLKRDHPRSRGVYYGIRCVRSYVLGSSPLARGLPGLTRPTTSATRIIPARAGFTRKELERSIIMSGSSPLARGLLFS